MLHRPYQLTNQTDSVQPAIENSFTQRLRSDPKQHIWVNPHPDYQELETVELYWNYRTQTPQEREQIACHRRAKLTSLGSLISMLFIQFSSQAAMLQNWCTEFASAVRFPAMCIRAHT